MVRHRSAVHGALSRHQAAVLDQLGWTSAPASNFVGTNGPVDALGLPGQRMLEAVLQGASRDQLAVRYNATQLGYPTQLEWSVSGLRKYLAWYLRNAPQYQALGSGSVEPTAALLLLDPALPPDKAEQALAELMLVLPALVRELFGIRVVVLNADGQTLDTAAAYTTWQTVEQTAQTLATAAREGALVVTATGFPPGYLLPMRSWDPSEPRLGDGLLLPDELITTLTPTAELMAMSLDSGHASPPGQVYLTTVWEQGQLIPNIEEAWQNLLTTPIPFDQWPPTNNTTYTSIPTTLPPDQDPHHTLAAWLTTEILLADLSIPSPDPDHNTPKAIFQVFARIPPGTDTMRLVIAPPLARHQPDPTPTNTQPGFTGISLHQAQKHLTALLTQPHPPTTSPWLLISSLPTTRPLHPQDVTQFVTEYYTAATELGPDVAGTHHDILTRAWTWLAEHTTPQLTPDARQMVHDSLIWLHSPAPQPGTYTTRINEMVPVFTGNPTLPTRRPANLDQASTPDTTPTTPATVTLRSDAPSRATTPAQPRTRNGMSTLPTGQQPGGNDQEPAQAGPTHGFASSPPPAWLDYRIALDRHQPGIDAVGTQAQIHRDLRDLRAGQEPTWWGPAGLAPIRASLWELLTTTPLPTLLRLTDLQFADTHGPVQASTVTLTDPQGAMTRRPSSEFPRVQFGPHTTDLINNPVLHGRSAWGSVWRSVLAEEQSLISTGHPARNNPTLAQDLHNAWTRLRHARAGNAGQINRTTHARDIDQARGALRTLGVDPDRLEIAHDLLRPRFTGPGRLGLLGGTPGTAPPNDTTPASLPTPEPPLPAAVLARISHTAPDRHRQIAHAWLTLLTHLGPAYAPEPTTRDTMALLVEAGLAHTYGQSSEGGPFYLALRPEAITTTELTTWRNWITDNTHGPQQELALLRLNGRAHNEQAPLPNTIYDTMFKVGRVPQLCAYQSNSNRTLPHSLWIREIYTHIWLTQTHAGPGHGKYFTSTTLMDKPLNIIKQATGTILKALRTENLINAQNDGPSRRYLYNLQGSSRPLGHQQDLLGWISRLQNDTQHHNARNLLDPQFIINPDHITTSITNWINHYTAQHHGWATTEQAQTLTDRLHRLPYTAANMRPHDWAGQHPHPTPQLNWPGGTPTQYTAWTTIAKQLTNLTHHYPTPDTLNQFLDEFALLPTPDGATVPDDTTVIPDDTAQPDTTPTQPIHPDIPNTPPDTTPSISDSTTPPQQQRQQYFAAEQALHQAQQPHNTDGEYHNEITAVPATLNHTHTQLNALAQTDPELTSLPTSTAPLPPTEPDPAATTHLITPDAMPWSAPTSPLPLTNSHTEWNDWIKDLINARYSSGQITTLLSAHGYTHIIAPDLIHTGLDTWFTAWQDTHPDLASHLDIGQLIDTATLAIHYAHNIVDVGPNSNLNTDLSRLNWPADAAPQHLHEWQTTTELLQLLLHHPANYTPSDINALLQSLLALPDPFDTTDSQHQLRRASPAWPAGQPQSALPATPPGPRQAGLAAADAAQDGDSFYTAMWLTARDYLEAQPSVQQANLLGPTHSKIWRLRQALAGYVAQHATTELAASTEGLGFLLGEVTKGEALDLWGQVDTTAPYHGTHIQDPILAEVQNAVTKWRGSHDIVTPDDAQREGLADAATAVQHAQRALDEVTNLLATFGNPITLSPGGRAALIYVFEAADRAAGRDGVTAAQDALLSSYTRAHTIGLPVAMPDLITAVVEATIPAAVNRLAQTIATPGNGNNRRAEYGIGLFQTAFGIRITFIDTEFTEQQDDDGQLPATAPHVYLLRVRPPVDHPLVRQGVLSTGSLHYRAVIPHNPHTGQAELYVPTTAPLPAPAPKPPAAVLADIPNTPPDTAPSISDSTTPQQQRQQYFAAEQALHQAQQPHNTDGEYHNEITAVPATLNHTHTQLNALAQTDPELTSLSTSTAPLPPTEPDPLPDSPNRLDVPAPLDTPTPPTAHLVALPAPSIDQNTWDSLTLDQFAALWLGQAAGSSPAATSDEAARAQAWYLFAHLLTLDHPTTVTDWAQAGITPAVTFLRAQAEALVQLGLAERVDGQGAADPRYQVTVAAITSAQRHAWHGWASKLPAGSHRDNALTYLAATPVPTVVSDQPTTDDAFDLAHLPALPDAAKAKLSDLPPEHRTQLEEGMARQAFARLLMSTTPVASTILYKKGHFSSYCTTNHLEHVLATIGLAVRNYGPRTYRFRASGLTLSRAEQREWRHWARTRIPNYRYNEGEETNKVIALANLTGQVAPLAIPAAKRARVLQVGHVKESTVQSLWLGSLAASDADRTIDGIIRPLGPYLSPTPAVKSTTLRRYIRVMIDFGLLTTDSSVTSVTGRIPPEMTLEERRTLLNALGTITDSSARIRALTRIGAHYHLPPQLIHTAMDHWIALSHNGVVPDHLADWWRRTRDLLPYQNFNLFLTDTAELVFDAAGWRLPWPTDDNARPVHGDAFHRFRNAVAGLTGLIQDAITAAHSGTATQQAFTDLYSDRIFQFLLDSLDPTTDTGLHPALDTPQSWSDILSNPDRYLDLDDPAADQLMDIDHQPGPADVEDQQLGAALAPMELLGPLDGAVHFSTPEPIRIPIATSLSWVLQINPTRDIKGPDAHTNCLLTMIALDATLQELPAPQFPTSDTTGPAIQPFAAPPEGLAVAKHLARFLAGRPLTTMPGGAEGYRQIVTAMQAAGPGARGVVSIHTTHDPGAHGHLINVWTTRAGTVLFLDAQDDYVLAQLPRDPVRLRLALLSQPPATVHATAMPSAAVPGPRTTHPAPPDTRSDQPRSDQPGVAVPDSATPLANRHSAVSDADPPRPKVGHFTVRARLGLSATQAVTAWLRAQHNPAVSVSSIQPATSPELVVVEVAGDLLDTPATVGAPWTVPVATLLARNPTLTGQPARPRANLDLISRPRPESAAPAGVTLRFGADSRPVAATVPRKQKRGKGILVSSMSSVSGGSRVSAVARLPRPPGVSVVAGTFDPGQNALVPALSSGAGVNLFGRAKTTRPTPLSAEQVAQRYGTGVRAIVLVAGGAAANRQNGVESFAAEVARHVVGVDLPVIAPATDVYQLPDGRLAAALAGEGGSLLVGPGTGWWVFHPDGRREYVSGLSLDQVLEQLRDEIGSDEPGIGIGTPAPSGEVTVWPQPAAQRGAPTPGTVFTMSLTGVLATSPARPSSTSTKPVGLPTQAPVEPEPGAGVSIGAGRIYFPRGDEQHDPNAMHGFLAAHYLPDFAAAGLTSLVMHADPKADLVPRDNRFLTYDEWAAQYLVAHPNDGPDTRYLLFTCGGGLNKQGGNNTAGRALRNRTRRGVLTSGGFVWQTKRGIFTTPFEPDDNQETHLIEPNPDNLPNYPRETGWMYYPPPTEADADPDPIYLGHDLRLAMRKLGMRPPDTLAAPELPESIAWVHLPGNRGSLGQQGFARSPRTAGGAPGHSIHNRREPCPAGDRG